MHSFVTGISDHYHLITSMLKTRFEIFSSKEIRYRSYKDVSKNSLIRKIESDANLIQSGDLESLQTVISKSPSTNFVFKNVYQEEIANLTWNVIFSHIQKGIMTRSRLKSKANKSRKEEYMKAYKKQKVTQKFLKRRSCYPSIMKIIEKPTNEAF